MSTSYEIAGVTVTPQGGGFYELTHPGLPEPVKERGKENADARAQAIADALKSDDDGGSMAPQGDLTAATPPAMPPASDAAKDDEIARLKAQLEAAEKARVDAEARAEEAIKLQPRTIISEGDEDAESPAAARVPSGVPRKYENILDDAAKAELKRLGIETTDIVLEENEAIPPTGLFLGHNGRGYIIVPGEPVSVPNFLLGVLDDAVMSTPVVDSKTRKVLGYRDRRRYNYRLV